VTLLAGLVVSCDGQTLIVLTALIVLLAAALVLLAGEVVRVQCHRMLRNPAFIPLRSAEAADLPANVPVA
jgi:hypothetical protein